MAVLATPLKLLALLGVLRASRAGLRLDMAVQQAVGERGVQRSVRTERACQGFIVHVILAWIRKSMVHGLSCMVHLVLKVRQ